MTAHGVTTAAILGLAMALASLAHAGGKDLRPVRELSRDPAKARAQEAQKQKLLAKLRAEAPTRIDRAPAVDALELPLFAERRVP